MRPPGRVATSYDGPIYAHSAPSRDVLDLGPIVDEPMVGLGYVMLLSYSCDYAERLKLAPDRTRSPRRAVAVGRFVVQTGEGAGAWWPLAVLPFAAFGIVVARRIRHP